jgi:hypothetical protein
MINLLPPTARRTISQIYWLRVLTVWATTVTIGAVVVLLLLVPPYVLISSQVTAYQSDAAAAAEKIDSYRVAAAALVTASNQADWVVKAAAAPALLDVIARIEAATIPGIRLVSITVARSETGLAPILVSGVAERRLPLVTYLETVQALPGVERAFFPNSNLAAGDDIPFTVEITLAQPTS